MEAGGGLRAPGEQPPAGPSAFVVIPAWEGGVPAVASQPQALDGVGAAVGRS